MVLLPKKQDAMAVKVYKPILLIHIIGKLFSKVLANRLAPKLSALVHSTQSGFVKRRFIQDNYRCVQATTKLLHARKNHAILMQIDLARAFDSVAWSFLLEVLWWMGFMEAWLNWVEAILSMAST
jgi:hypothetical protein